MIFLAKSRKLISTCLFLSSTFFVSIDAVSAQSFEKTYRIGHDYGGVHRCGNDAENKKEARIAAEDKIRSLSADTGFGVSLVDFKIVDHSTRRWEEKDRFGISKGRKCATHLEIDVIGKIII